MKSKVVRHASKATGSIFKYDTNKIVEINSKKIGLIFRFFQLLIISYIIGYVMIYMHGYQESHGLTSSVVTKVKGISQSNNHSTLRKMWDIPDLIVPPQEKSAFFITTNVVVTENQTQSHCPEAYDIPNAQCTSNNNCTKNSLSNFGNGIATGMCVKTIDNKSTCEILGWCPLENDTFPAYIKPFMEVLDFTVLIKNTIIFDELNIIRSNLFLWESGKIPKNCLYDPKDQFLKYCPIFKIKSFITADSKSDLMDLLSYGGVIQVIITWDCNLDYSASECKPVYTFDRLDISTVRMGRGWNFRYANYFKVNNKEYRTLYKAFGLRVVIEVRGKARKLSLITLTMNLGSGAALLSVATLICDIIILYLLPNRKKYAETIFELHDDDDAYQELDETNQNENSIEPDNK